MATVHLGARQCQWDPISSNKGCYKRKEKARLSLSISNFLHRLSPSRMLLACHLLHVTLIWNFQLPPVSYISVAV